jgi:hypothetical protein
MRVNRALEKLHSLLKRRGVTLSAAALGTMLAGQVVSAAPTGLAVGISNAVLAGAAAGSGITLTSLKLILMAKLKIGIVSAVVVASVVTPLVLHHHARAKLREQEDSLRQQQSQLTALTEESKRLSNLAASSSLSSNLPEELQRLRAEAGTLQQQTSTVARLRDENRRLQASVARPSTPLEMREEAIARMDFSKYWMLAFIFYAEKHQDQFPTDFGQAKDFLPEQAKAENNVTTDQFEIVYQGKWRDVKKPAETIVLREKQARQTPNGNWTRAYGFADGHSEIHSAADGNFEPWEKDRILTTATLGQ